MKTTPRTPVLDVGKNVDVGITNDKTLIRYFADSLDVIIWGFLLHEPLQFIYTLGKTTTLQVVYQSWSNSYHLLTVRYPPTRTCVSQTITLHFCGLTRRDSVALCRRPRLIGNVRRWSVVCPKPLDLAPERVYLYSVEATKGRDARTPGWAGWPSFSLRPSDADALFRRRRRQKITKNAAASTPTPATTPPIIGPALLAFLLLPWETDEEAESVLEDVALASSSSYL